MKHSPWANMKQKPCGFYEAAALPPRSEAHIFHFSCCEATLHSRRLLHELLRNSLNAPSVRFIATKNEKAVHWTAFVFVLCRLNRCHGEKVNKIKGFRLSEASLCTSKIDAAYFNNDRYSSESPDKTVFEQFSFTSLNL